MSGARRMLGMDVAPLRTSRDFRLVFSGAGGAVPPPPAPHRPSLRSIATGLRYARSRPELLGTYLVDINAMFFGMAQALYPFVAARLGGPAVLGLLYAAASAGALLATMTSRWTGRVHRHGLAVTLAAATWGLAIVGFGFAGTLWFALVCLTAAGAADMISGVFRSVIWNQTIPDHLRGRLAGIEMLSYTIGPTLGNARAGAAALPAFLRYDGRDGLARKLAEDEEWVSQAAARQATEIPVTGTPGVAREWVHGLEAGQPD